MISEFYYLDGHIEVQKYGRVGERVKGLIEGTVINFLLNDTLHVMGEFSLIRKPDYIKNYN